MNYLKNTEMAKQAKEIIHITEPLHKLTGVDQFGLTRIYKDNTHFNLCTHPEWLEEFYAKYYQHGLCHKSYDAYKPGYYFQQEAKDQLTVKKMREDFCIHSGITIIEKNLDYCDVYTFCTTRITKEINFYIQHVEIWYKFISFFKERGQEVLEKAKIDREILPKVLDVKNKDYPFLSNPFLLTEKQKICLFLILKGRTLKEIAKILGVSPRTIECHLEAIKSKMHCQYKSELIEKAIDSGFLYRTT